MEEPVNQESNRNPDGTFKQGMSGNPKGRPKGQTMKEFARQFLMNLENKEEWLSDLPKDVVWRMAEGNPKQDTDITTAGKPIIQLTPEIIEKNAITHSTEPDSEGQSQV